MNGPQLQFLARGNPQYLSLATPSLQAEEQEAFPGRFWIPGKTHTVRQVVFRSPDWHCGRHGHAFHTWGREPMGLPEYTLLPVARPHIWRPPLHSEHSPVKYCGD